MDSGFSLTHQNHNRSNSSAWRTTYDMPSKESRSRPPSSRSFRAHVRLSRSTSPSLEPCRQAQRISRKAGYKRIALRSPAVRVRRQGDRMVEVGSTTGIRRATCLHVVMHLTHLVQPQQRQDMASGKKLVGVPAIAEYARYCVGRLI